ncbi:MAG: hypothetical protein SOU08_07080 [Anaerococcus sp.]|nr:hypothetical protein [Anaerococcus sp.]
MTGNKIVKFLPQVITVLAGSISLILHTLFIKAELIPFVQVIASGCVVMILPKLEFMAEKNSLWFLNLVYAFFIVLAVDLGSVSGFYDLFLWRDTVMHGAFGFICSVSIYILFLKDSYDLKNRSRLLLIFLATMGCGSLWEIFEFSVDNILGMDTQRVGESIALGKTPVYDTMVDIIITIAGFIVFVLIYSLYKRKLKK